jgi:hypothetical protein
MRNFYRFSMVPFFVVCLLGLTSCTTDPVVTVDFGEKVVVPGDTFPVTVNISKVDGVESIKVHAEGANTGIKCDPNYEKAIVYSWTCTVSKDAKPGNVNIQVELEGKNGKPLAPNNETISISTPAPTAPPPATFTDAPPTATPTLISTPTPTNTSTPQFTETPPLSQSTDTACPAGKKVCITNPVEKSKIIRQAEISGIVNLNKGEKLYIIHLILKMKNYFVNNTIDPMNNTFDTVEFVGVDEDRGQPFMLCAIIVSDPKVQNLLDGKIGSRLDFPGFPSPYVDYDCIKVTRE